MSYDKTTVGMEQMEAILKGVELCGCTVEKIASKAIDIHSYFGTESGELSAYLFPNGQVVAEQILHTNDCDENDIISLHYYQSKEQFDCMHGFVVNES